MHLLEWTRLFLKHQDLLRHEIEDITEIGGGLSIKKKSGEEEWVVGDIETSLPRLDDKRKQGLVCLNTHTNLDALIANWEALASHPTLKIVFANPKKNLRWIIIPAQHQSVADKASFKTGLEAMFASVPEA